MLRQGSLQTSGGISFHACNRGSTPRVDANNKISESGAFLARFFHSGHFFVIGSNSLPYLAAVFSKRDLNWLMEFYGG